MLDRLHLLRDVTMSRTPFCEYVVNGNTYKILYWLADGIYPQHHCFIKTIPNPNSRRHKFYASQQEARRKDIERAFGILQARFHILTIAIRLWDRDAIHDAVKACVILYNKVIDSELRHGIYRDYINDEVYVPVHPIEVVERNHDIQLCYDAQMVNLDNLRDVAMHILLQADLVQHLWEHTGNNDTLH